VRLSEDCRLPVAIVLYEFCGATAEALANEALGLSRKGTGTAQPSSPPFHNIPWSKTIPRPVQPEDPW
jgi:hypothetical protein